MPKVKITGLDSFLRDIERLDTKSDQIIGSGVYVGAKVLADEISAGIDGLKTSSSVPARRERLEKQKKGLKDSFGIAKMQDDRGFKNVLIGFDGYNDVKTKSHPEGQPNVMVARMFNSGTSTGISRTAFFEKAVRTARNNAKKIAAEEIEKRIKDATK